MHTTEEISWERLIEMSLALMGAECRFSSYGTDYRGKIKTLFVRAGTFVIEFECMAVSINPGSWEILPDHEVPSIRGEKRSKKILYVKEPEKVGVIIEELADTDRVPPFHIFLRGGERLDYHSLPVYKPPKG
ncbi:MAG TPA: hypothetical protein VFQ72_04255 [Candidatus Paceibacterota bacterium]|nr:hypothetical protein [Candidatus Paceibacterota bacterium]